MEGEYFRGPRKKPQNLNPSQPLHRMHPHTPINFKLFSFPKRKEAICLVPSVDIPPYTRVHPSRRPFPMCPTKAQIPTAPSIKLPTSANWPNGKASDYDSNRYQEIAGSSPALVTIRGGSLVFAFRMTGIGVEL